MNKVENKRFNIMKNNDYKFSTMIFLRKYNKKIYRFQQQITYRELQDFSKSFKNTQSNILMYCVVVLYLT